MAVIARRELLLQEQDIDAFSLYLMSFLTQHKCEHRDAVKMRLVVEDALLSWMNQGQHGKKVVCQFHKKFNGLVLDFRLVGPRVNPLQTDSLFSDNEYLNTTLFAMIKNMEYSYSQGVNRLSGTINFDQPYMLYFMALAMILGIGCGYLGMHFYPGTAEFLAVRIFAPLYDHLMGLLTAFIAPIIFLSLLNGIVNVSNPAQLHKLGRGVIGTYLKVTALAAVLTTAVLGGILPLDHSSGYDLSTLLMVLGRIFLNFIPTNLFTPFTTGNIMQIVVMAVIFGVFIIYMQEKLEQLLKILKDLQKLLDGILQVITYVMPVLIFLGLFSMMCTKMEGIFQIFVYVLVSFSAFSLLSFVLASVYLGATLHANPWPVIKKMLSPMLVRFSTCSSVLAFPEEMEVGKKKLGIEEGFLSFALPLGQMIFKLGFVPEYICVILMLLYYYKLPIDFSTLFLVGVISIILSLTSGPIAGSALVNYALAFSIFHILKEALAFTMVIIIFTDFLGTMLCVYGNLVFDLTVAKKVGMVDEKILFNEN